LEHRNDHRALMDLAAITARAAAMTERASAIAMRHFRGRLEISTKSDASPVTQADRETEAFLRRELEQSFPDHAIFGEEFGISGDLTGPSWIIDPIDGTRSYLSGHPTFGMLLAHLQGGVPRAGIVRMPALDETFAAHANGTATLNGTRIQTRDTKRLSDAILYINEPEKIFADNPDRFARLCTAGHTRRMSYDCYPHALVAAGHVDAVCDIGLEPYDYLPLVPLIEAAGGIITDWAGAPLSLQSDGRVVTAATPDLYARLRDLIAD
jgi:histidinol phosphatase-like enzyme (inositol monophosphatase family)